MAYDDPEAVNPLTTDRAPDPLDRIAPDPNQITRALQPTPSPPVVGPTPGAAEFDRATPPEDRQQQQLDLETSRAQTEADRSDARNRQIRDELGQRMLQGLDENERLRQQRAREEAPIIADQQRRLQHPMPAKPQFQIPPEVPKAMGAAQDWMLAAYIFSALAGAVVRGNSTAALSAMGGMMNGFVQGRDDVIKQQLEVWDRENKRALEINQIRLNEYKEALEARDGPIEQNLQMMKLIGAKYQDLMIDVKDFSTAASLYDRMIDGHQKMEMNYLRTQKLANDLKKQHDEQMMREHAKLTPEMANFMARRVLAGDQFALQTIGGRGIERQAAFNMINAEIQKIAETQNLPPDAVARAIGEMRAWMAGQSSAARSGGTREAQLAMATRVLEQAIPQAEQASKNVPRTSWVSLNRAIQAGQREFSDPRLSTFAGSNIQLAELWARAMNPTGVMRQGDRDLALAYLSTSDGPQSYQAKLAFLKRAVQNEMRGVAIARTELPGGTRLNPDQFERYFGGTKPQEQQPSGRIYQPGETITRGGKTYRVITGGPDPDVEEVRP